MNDLNNQTAYWDRVAADKTFTLPFDTDSFSEHVCREARILDYGCGYGRGLAELWEEGYHNILGYDTSSAMIERGKDAWPHLPMQPMPYTLERSAFDAVILVAVLTCIPENDAQENLIAAISRALRPGGLLYLSDFWLQDDARNFERYKKARQKYAAYGVFELDEGVVLRHHDRDWITHLLADFEVITLVDIDVMTMNGHRAKAFRYLGRKRR